MPQYINHQAAPVIRIGSSVLFIASIAAVMGSLPVPQATTVATAVPADKSAERTMIAPTAPAKSKIPHKAYIKGYDSYYSYSKK